MISSWMALHNLLRALEGVDLPPAAASAVRVGWIALRRPAALAVEPHVDEDVVYQPVVDAQYRFNV